MARRVAATPRSRVVLAVAEAGRATLAGPAARAVPGGRSEEVVEVGVLARTGPAEWVAMVRQE